MAAAAVAVVEKSLLGTSLPFALPFALPFPGKATLFAHSWLLLSSLLHRRKRSPLQASQASTAGTGATSGFMAFSSGGLIDGRMDEAALATVSARGERQEAAEWEGNERERGEVKTSTATETTWTAAAGATGMSTHNAENELWRLRRCRRCQCLGRRRRRLRLKCRFRLKHVCSKGEGEGEVEEEEGVGGIIRRRRNASLKGLSAASRRDDLQRAEAKRKGDGAGKEGQNVDCRLVDCFGAEYGQAGTDSNESSLASRLRHPEPTQPLTAVSYSDDGVRSAYFDRQVPRQCGGSLAGAAMASVRHRKRIKWRIPGAGGEGVRNRLSPTTPAPLLFAVPPFLPLCMNSTLGLCPRPRRRRLRPGARQRPCWGKIFLLLCSWATLLGWSAVTMPRGAEAAKGGEFMCDDRRPSEHAACIPQAYSKYELPDSDDVDNITRIDIQLDIQEVLRINDKDYSISFSTYFNVYWHERRIRLRPDFGKEQLEAGTKPTDVSVPTNLEFLKDLWVPNILIYNLKSYRVIDVLNQLAGLWITPSKQILYSQATHITFICPMRFDKFPLDKQTCKFTLGSYSYNDAKMVFKTMNAGYSAPKVSNSIALDYAITITKLKPQDTVLDYANLGNYSLAGFEMVLHRYVSTYIITYYLPSGLFVIVSWISFLIPMDVIPGRMALLVTLFLVLVNIFNSVTTNTPKAEGLTAIEAWMLACILFVFGALIE